jgi:hypothetical protein
MGASGAALPNDERRRVPAIMAIFTRVRPSMRRRKLTTVNVAPGEPAILVCVCISRHYRPLPLQMTPVAILGPGSLQPQRGEEEAKQSERRRR